MAGASSVAACEAGSGSNARLPRTPARMPVPWRPSARCALQGPAVARRLALLLAWLLAWLLACSDERAPPPGARTGRSMPDAARTDGGGAPMPSPRPPEAPRLPEADQSVELPFGGAAVVHTIEIAAAPRALDLVFNVDTTGSMGGEIDELQESLSAVVAPELRARVPDVSFAVARFEDFPAPPWGSAGVEGMYRGDEPYSLLTAVTSDAAQVSSALASLDRPLGEGGDIDESGAEALWQIATGAGYSHGGATLIRRYAGMPAPGGGKQPGVGFRDGTLRAVVHVTDAPSHAPSDYAPQFPGTHDVAEAAAALLDADVRVLGILSSACTDPEHEGVCNTSAYARARAQLVELSTTTHALGDAVDGACPYGVGGRALDAISGRCPLVFEVAETGEGLSAALVDAVVALVDGTRFALVSAEATADAIGFVAAVTPVQADDGPERADELPAAAPDGRLDSFVDVRAGQDLAFAVTLRNRAVPARDYEQRFRVLIEVRGDGVVLEQRTLRVMVPAGAGLVPDASSTADEDSGAPAL